MGADQLQAEAIHDIIRKAAKSIGSSFANYWPANGDNDPAEMNVTIHFAHVLLQDGFSVFAEADHPDRKNVQGIDLLGLAPECQWFLGCELKRLYSTEKLTSMRDDLDRLASFWINRGLREKSYGEAVRRSVMSCDTGFGLVAGLHWVTPGSQSKIYELWNDPSFDELTGEYLEFRDRIFELDGTWVPPIPVHTFVAGGSYYLLSAFFEIN